MGDAVSRKKRHSLRDKVRFFKEPVVAGVATLLDVDLPYGISDARQQK